MPIEVAKKITEVHKVISGNNENQSCRKMTGLIQTSSKKNLIFSWFRRKNRIQEEKETSAETTLKSKENVEKVQLLPPRKFDWYFEPKPFEKSGKIYEILGVKPFQKLYLATLGKVVEIIWHKSHPDTPFSYVHAIQTYEKATRWAESIHIAALPLLAPLVPFTLQLDLSISRIAIFLLIGVYPIILQRYNRARVYRILEKAKEKREAADTNPSEKLA